MRLLLVAAIVVALAFPAVATASSGPEVVVFVRDDPVTHLYRFDPPLVEIAPGTTVVWRNVGSLYHTVTLTAATTGDAFDVGLGGSGDCGASPCEFRHTFESVGVIAYHCAPHVYMMHAAVAVG